MEGRGGEEAGGVDICSYLLRRCNLEETGQWRCGGGCGGFKGGMEAEGDT